MRWHSTLSNFPLPHGQQVRRKLRLRRLFLPLYPRASAKQGELSLFWRFWSDLRIFTALFFYRSLRRHTSFKNRSSSNVVICSFPRIPPRKALFVSVTYAERKHGFSRPAASYNLVSGEIIFFSKQGQYIFYGVVCKRFGVNNHFINCFLLSRALPETISGITLSIYIPNGVEILWI